MLKAFDRDEREAVGGITVILACIILSILIDMYFANQTLVWQLGYSFLSNDAGTPDYNAITHWNVIVMAISWFMVVLVYALVTKRIPSKTRKNGWQSGKALLCYAVAAGILSQLLFRYPGVYTPSAAEITSGVYTGYDAGAVANFQGGLTLLMLIWTALLLWYSNFPVKSIVRFVKKSAAESAANRANPLPALQTITVQHSTSTGQATSSQLNQQTPPKRKQPAKDDTILGRDVETKELVGVNQKERLRGMYVIGKNGTGKTTFLINIMLQDILAGLGLCFIAHGDATNDLLRRLPKERKDDVIIINPLHKTHTFGLNLYECADPTDLELAAAACEQVMHVFEKLWGADSKTPSWSPQMADLLRNIANTFIQCQGLTFAEVSLLLTDDDTRNNVMNKLTNTELRIFWMQYAKRKDQNEYTASTLTKVRAFLSNPLVQQIVGQARSTINFRKFMDEGKIILIQLPERYEEMTALLGAMFVAQLLNAALSRSDTPEDKRRLFNLYVDEYQNFCTPDMVRLMAEGRRLRFGSTTCHQFLTQLDIISRGATLNAANIVVFRVSGTDGEQLAKEFDCTPLLPDVIGWRPKLTPKQDVVDHLLKNGHSNPVVSEFVTAYLRDIDRFSKLDTSFLLPNNPKQFAMITNLHNALPDFNTALFQVMQKKNADVSIPEFFIDSCSQFFGYEQLWKYLTKKEKAAICSGSLSFSLQVGKEENTHLRQLVTSIRQVMHILSIDPILGDSGQTEPIYDKPRTYADVQNQVATELANLPPYHAKCKLGQDELVIQSLPLADGRNDEELAQFTEEIMQRSIDLCYRSRNEIMEEIADRQAQLTTLVQAKRRTIQGEEI